MCFGGMADGLAAKQDQMSKSPVGMIFRGQKSVGKSPWVIVCGQKSVGKSPWTNICGQMSLTNVRGQKDRGSVPII